MSKEAPRVPEFGVYLRRCRGERSLEALSQQMRAIGVDRVNSALFHYEAGRVPPVDVIRGLSFALRVPFEELIDRVLRELRIAPISWAEPIVQKESNLPDDALAVARAYAASQEPHVKAATRALLQLDREIKQTGVASRLNEVSGARRRFP